MAEDLRLWIDGVDGMLVGAAGDGGARADDADALIARGAKGRLRTGRDDSLTGTLKSSFIRGTASAEAVLQATTIILACSTRRRPPISML